MTSYTQDIQSLPKMNQSDSSRKTNCNPKMTHFTKENIDLLWNSIEYTKGTIGPGCRIESLEKPDWTLIHKGRAHSSYEFLNQAIELVNQMKAELREESK